MAMTKKVVRFSGKIGVTPSVAVPGDNNPSDATIVSDEVSRDIWGKRFESQKRLNSDNSVHHSQRLR